MLSSVLKSDTAADIGIIIVKTFVQLREMLSTNKELAAKLIELDRRRVSEHEVPAVPGCRVPDDYVVF